MVEKWANEQKMKAEALAGNVHVAPAQPPQTISSLKEIGIGGLM